MSRIQILCFVLAFAFLPTVAQAQFRFPSNPILPNPLPPPLSNFPPAIPVPDLVPTFPGNTPTVCNSFAPAAALERCLQQFQNTSIPPQLLESFPQNTLAPISTPAPTAQPDQRSPIFAPPPLPPTGLGAPQSCPVGSRLQLLAGGYACLSAP